MPVRIYQIAKKLGIPSKQVLQKAQQLGLKVESPANTIDKITAEDLENQIRKELGQTAPTEGEKQQAEQVGSAIEPEEPAAASPAPRTMEEPPAKATVSPPTTAMQPKTPSTPSMPPSQPPPQSENVPAVTPQPPPSQPAPSTPPQSAPATPPSQPPPISAATSVPSTTQPLSQPAEPPTTPPAQEVKPSSEAQPPSVSPAPSNGKKEEEPTMTAAKPVQAEPQTSSAQPVVEKPAPQAQPAKESPSKPPVEKEEKEEKAESQIVTKVGFIDVSKFVRPTPKREAERSRAKKRKEKKEKKAKAKAEKAKAKAEKKQAKGQAARPQPRPSTPPKKPSLPPMPPPETLTEGEVVMRPPIIVRDLAAALGKKPFQIIADLMEWGYFITVNQAIEDPEVARRLCAKYKKRFRLERRGDKTQSPVAVAARRPLITDEEDKPEDLKPRPPVVTIMGHVDHGKTTLLDAIRQSNIVATEAGQITQHIGAYTITIPHPEKKNQKAQITFIDTPGHEAFTAMWARGANVTDIVVLVVAADDGVMPQTEEAIQHAKAAGVPIIVAVNKIDHPNANPMMVRTQLQQLGLVPDEWGGDTIFVDISALKKQGIDTLLEMILLQAEMLDLKANPNRKAKGRVLESAIEKAGPTATFLVQTGTLRLGDAVVCGPYYGKVRALIDDWGNRVKEAGPSIAVKVLGLNGAPEPGAEFQVVENERTAREIAEERMEELEEKKAAAGVRRPRGVAELLRVVEEESRKVLRLVIKADTQGTAQAVADALRKIESEEVSLEIVSTGVGSISENDVLLASASDAVVIGFNVKVDSAAAQLAKQEGVQIKVYSIIYHLIDEVKQAMQALVEPEFREVVHGEALVRQIFHLSKVGTVAGCEVRTGKILRNSKARVIRDGQVLFDGNLASLRHLKEDVPEVRAGMECGIRLEGFSDFEEGDIIQSYTIEQTK